MKLDVCVMPSEVISMTQILHISNSNNAASQISEVITLKYLNAQTSLHETWYIMPSEAMSTVDLMNHSHLQ
jgi:hypothetical protein